MPKDNQEQEHPAIVAARVAANKEEDVDELSPFDDERERHIQQIMGTVEQDIAPKVEADMATAPDIDVRAEYTSVDMPRIGKVLSQTTARETMELDLDRSEVTEILRNYACRLMGLPADEAPNISFKFRENTGNFVLTYVKESHSYG